MQVKRYVAAFIFDLSGNRVLLIKKNKPAWQAGYYNGIGGAIESGETALQAIIREIKEEVNLSLSTFTNFVELKGGAPEIMQNGRIIAGGESWSVEFFFCYTNKIASFKNNTSELAEIFNVKLLPNTLPNVRWLIQMALDFGLDRADKLIIEEIHN